MIWKIAYNLWCTKAKNYIKEKNNTIFDENHELSYETQMLDKIIYKEISKKINTKEANIKYFLYSARNKIKEKYDE